MPAGHGSYTVKIERHRPTSGALPLLIYRAALPRDEDPGDACERLFAGNGWGGIWRDGIYPYHHFHATTHEVLGIAEGDARVRFGGDDGPLVTIRMGDVVIIPAGVSHKNEGASADLLVIGAYPGEREPDIQKGEPEDHRHAAESVQRVPLPTSDPVFGAEGPLLREWSSAPARET